MAWIEHATGEPLYDWQREVLSDLAAEQRPRVAYVQVPRKNGKTRLAAALALVEVCLKERRHVYCIADSERNLNSVLIRELRDMIGGSEHLRDSIHVFKDKIEVPETGSFIQTRPSNFQASQGVNPHLVLFDEVHLQRDDTIWSGMQMAGAARTNALLFGITTPGYDLTSMAHGLYQSVKAGDPTLYGKVYEADPALPINDVDNLKRANPCYDRPGFAEALEFDRNRLPEHEFWRFRAGVWTATESAWLPYGAWDALAISTDEPPQGTKVWLGFDGSYSGDSTALVGCTNEGHVFVAGCWENPGRKGWRVPRDEVNDTVVNAMDWWNVQELVCDPPYWEREIAEWDARWPDKVTEFATYSRARMAPGLVVEINGTELDPADYQLTPANGAPQGRPWTAIEILPRSPIKPTGEDVKVTAEWGWAAVPDAIKLACLIQAARFYERRQNVGGQLTRKEVDDVRLGWSASATHELDADVLFSIARYRKLWLAV